MLDIADKVFLGKILKTHGISGDVILQSKALGVLENIELELVFLLIDGKPVPFFIQQIRPKSSETFIIRFDYVDNINQAKEICDADVYGNEQISEAIENNTGIFKYIGYTLFNQLGQEIGIIDDVIDQTSNTLFSVSKEKNEWLIPASEELVISSKRRKKQLTLQIPEGLLDL